jgi:acyl carrier protein
VDDIRLKVQDAFENAGYLDSYKKLECDTLLKDQGIDSFTLMSIIFEIENVFSIKVSNTIVSKIKTLNDLNNFLSNI